MTMVVLGTIENSLREFLTDVAAYVLAHTSEVSQEGGERWFVNRTDGKRVLNSRSISHPDYLFFLHNHTEQITKLNAFTRLRDSISGDSKLTHAFLGRASSGDAISVAFPHYLLPLVAKVMRAVDDGGDWEAEVRLRLSELDDFLRKDTYEIVLCAPLTNFTSDSDVVELSSGVRVCKLSDAKLELYMNTVSSFMGHAKVHDLHRLRFQLEKVVEHPRESPYLPPNENGFQTECQNVLKAIRLIRSGAVGLAFVGSVSLGPHGFGPSWMTAPNQDRLFGELYTFSETDSPKVTELLAALELLEKDGRFALALRRFMGSFEKPFDGDRLIDYWIALESLLMPETGGELSYRVSLRGASFITEASERKQVFEELRASYDTRSKFVHGDPKGVVGQHIVSHTEEYLRRVLLRCLDSGDVPSREFLDSLVLQS